MPKPPFPAAGGAMAAASPDTHLPDLIDIRDELCRARHGVQAALMAARVLMKAPPVSGRQSLGPRGIGRGSFGAADASPSALMEVI
jgi:hypothetical protein